MILRGGDDEAAAPKYAHIERERRWLVDAALCPLPPDHVSIEDRYIDGTRLRLRRMTDSGDGRVVLKLTKKYDAADPAARPIVTAYLTGGEYAVFAALPARIVVKRRYAVDDFSVDVFDDPTGLPIIAEIECASAEALAAVVPPTWTRREITRDAAYQGAHLAMRG